MSTLREDLLPLFADLRPNLIDLSLGLRRYTVYVRVKTASDARGGIGMTYTNVDTLFQERPRVRPADTNDIVKSGGVVKVGDYMLDRITPRNDGNTVGTLPSFLNQAPSQPGQKVVIVLDGPDMPTYTGGVTPSGGGEFEIVSRNYTRNFGFTLAISPSTGAR